MATDNKWLEVGFTQGKSHFRYRASSVDSIDLAMLALDDQGVIRNCSQICEQVFGYRQDDLAGQHVSTLLPELKDAELVQGERINSLLAFLCHCAMPFKARHRDGDIFISELFINRLGSQNVVVLVRCLEIQHKARPRH